MIRTMTVMLFGLLAITATSITYAAGNANAGKSRTASCSGCHGEDGNSTAPIFPRLAGQNAAYIRRQLSDFKAGKRADPSMQAMAAPLSDKDIDDISAFYASLKPVYQEVEEEQYVDEDEEIPVTGELIAAGKTLYEAGNPESGVAPCTACHGPSGEGNAPAGFPVLKGQYLAYVIKSLTDFSDGLRNNDDGEMMQSVARHMSMDEIHSVSAYISSLK